LGKTQADVELSGEEKRQHQRAGEHLYTRELN
jgi:hypothetical protein